jgi:hypothetical protein
LRFFGAAASGCQHFYSRARAAASDIRGSGSRGLAFGKISAALVVCARKVMA